MYIMTDYSYELTTKLIDHFQFMLIYKKSFYYKNIYV